MPIQLRDYQRDCVQAVLSAWGEKPWHTEGDTFKSVLANLATSAGKTLISGAVIKEVMSRGRCLYIGDTDILCNQPRKKFSKFFGMHAALEKAGERASLLADVVVSSEQTLSQPDRLQRFDPAHFSYIFIDESHRSPDRAKKITDYFPAAKIMGMTATAFRAKLKDLSAYYQHVAFEMGVLDLVDEGYSPPIKILTLPVKVDLSEVHQKMSAEGMDYDKSELATKIEPYYEEICRLLLERAPTRHIVAFHSLIASSQKFVATARAMGIEARHIDGKSPDGAQILERFERKHFQLLSCASLLGTGWDCLSVDALLNLAPTRLRGPYLQKVGRIVRVLEGVIDGIEDKAERKSAIAASGKPDAWIIDCLFQSEKFNLQGPSDLIAANATEREAIQRALESGEARDLQEVTAEVQEAHEQRLKAALEAAAKRRSQFNDAVNLVAALLHDRKVTSYEPVMSWHRKDVSAEQKTWLIKQGVDPASATDRGHASAFMNLILGRKKAGLCSYRAVEALEKMGVTGAISMTPVQAFEVLEGNYPISFGRHAKHAMPLRAVPIGYWEWCMKAEQRRWFNMNTYPIEFGWAKHVIEPEESRCTCIGKYQAPNCPQHPRDPEPAASNEAGMQDGEIRTFSSETGITTLFEDRPPTKLTIADDEIPF